jgi:hypothetical protein
MKMESFVLPAWMAGIQVCRMHPETSMSAWIPALRAGMTESRSRTKTDLKPTTLSIFHEAHKGHEVRRRDLLTFFLPFVIFLSFVVSHPFQFFPAALR